VLGPDEARQLEPRPTVRRSKHDDLGTRVRDTDHGVEELALDEHPSPLHLKPQADEEVRRCVEIGDRDADVVKALDRSHISMLPDVQRSARGSATGRGAGRREIEV
jgi:hypothetical protein